MPSIEDIMKMANEAQAKLLEAQESLDKIEVEGVSGGGMVRIRASAKGRIAAVEIDRSLLQPSEKQMVEDLVAAAINDARTKADLAAQDAMRDATSGMPLPPGIKLPFERGRPGLASGRIPIGSRRAIGKRRRRGPGAEPPPSGRRSCCRNGG